MKLKPDKKEVLKVLVIDDEQVIASMFADMLEADGYDATVACSGYEGLIKARKYRPDIIILDLNMPVMDGFEVLEKLKKDDLTKNIPVLIASVKDGGEDMKKGFNLGAKKYFVKPCSFKRLSHELHECEGAG